MGVLFSCPADDYDPLDLEEAPPPAGAAAGEPAILKALGSGNLLIEGSLSFKRAQAALGSLQVETEISIRAAAAGDDSPAPAQEPAGNEHRHRRRQEPAVLCQPARAPVPVAVLLALALAVPGALLVRLLALLLAVEPAAAGRHLLRVVAGLVVVVLVGAHAVLALADLKGSCTRRNNGDWRERGQRPAG